MRPELLRSAASDVPIRPGREFSVQRRRRVERHECIDHLALRAHELAAHPANRLQRANAPRRGPGVGDPGDRALWGRPEVAWKQGSDWGVHGAQL
jgi:hypothetical protein